jgi:hypothetical protein
MSVLLGLETPAFVGEVLYDVYKSVLNRMESPSCVCVESSIVRELHSLEPPCFAGEVIYDVYRSVLNGMESPSCVC